MVEEPAATPVASPMPLTVAVDMLDEVRVNYVVISRVVASEYVADSVSGGRSFPTNFLLPLEQE